MPFALHGSDRTRVYWRSDGFAHKPPLLLLNSLGTDFAMWDALVPLLVERFRILRMDTRGHGASDAPPGSYTIPLLSEDVIAVLNAARVDQAHLCGISMGGMIALHLGVTAAQRVMKIVACNTSAQMPSEPWQQRAAIVREKGMEAIVDMLIGRFFSAKFIARNSASMATTRSTLLGLSPQGYAACCDALSQLDIFDRLSSIGAPLLVINGAKDVALPPPEHGSRIAAAVPGTRVKLLDTGHISALEAPQEFAEALLNFL